MLHVSIQNVQYYTTISKNVQRLFAGIQRVGRAGLGAINRLQPFKCRLYLRWDVIMRNIIFAVGAHIVSSPLTPSLLIILRQYRIILSADTASEVRQMLSQKRR